MGSRLSSVRRYTVGAYTRRPLSSRGGSGRFHAQRAGSGQNASGEQGNSGQCMRRDPAGVREILTNQK